MAIYTNKIQRPKIEFTVKGQVQGQFKECVVESGSSVKQRQRIINFFLPQIVKIIHDFKKFEI